MDRYEAEQVEAKWQPFWEAERAFHVNNPPPGTPPNPRKRYVLEQLPYPSGSLHMGHMLVYTLGDVRAHFYRRTGHEVLRPMGDRLGAGDLDARPVVLPLDAVAVPAVLRGGPRVPEGRAGEVVPERPDGARERAGDRRPLRALRRRGREAEPRAVVLQDHGVRRPAARRDEP